MERDHHVGKWVVGVVGLDGEVVEQLVPRNGMRESRLAGLLHGLDERLAVFAIFGPLRRIVLDAYRQRRKEKPYGIEVFFRVSVDVWVPNDHVGLGRAQLHARSHCCSSKLLECDFS